MDIQRVSSDRYEEAREVFSRSLGAGEPPLRGLEPPYWDLDRSLMAVEDGRILGVAATCRSAMTLPGGAALPLGAVPNVGVRADQQGRGIGRALLERQVAEAVGAGDALLALNASQTAIYGRFGYSPTSRWWSVEVDLHRTRWRSDAPEPVGTFRDVDDRDEALALARDVHDRGFGATHGDVRRWEGWWARFGRPRPDSPPAPSFAAYEVDGSAEAVAVFGVKLGFDDVGFSNRLDLRSLTRTSPEAGAHLVRWLMGRNLAGRLTTDTADVATPVQEWLVDARVWRTTAWADAAWTRVVDVPAVVEARATIGAGTVDVAVVDPLVPANHRTWRISGEHGALSCGPSDADPALTVPHDVLASLVFAHLPVATAAAAGRIEVHDPAAVAVLDSLWAWPTPSWCSTSF